MNNKQLLKKSNLIGLAPFLDSLGILRVGGRLKFSPYNFVKRHPILLPKSHLTDLIFYREHIIHMHAGPINYL